MKKNDFMHQVAMRYCCTGQLAVNSVLKAQELAHLLEHEGYPFDDDGPYTELRAMMKEKKASP